MRYGLLILILLIFSPASATQTAQDDLVRELVYRVSLGRAGDVDLLLKRTKNPNQMDSMGWPLLSIASARTDQEAIEIVKLLVATKADVNFGGASYTFPLMAAMQSGNTEVVKFLLDNKADYRKKDLYGTYLVEFARQTGNDDIIKLIDEAIDRDLSEQAARTSQRNLDKQVYNLAYDCCVSQYYSFYYKSEQDSIDQATQNATLNPHIESIAQTKGFLMRVFRLDETALDNICRESRVKMFNELEGMVSNRNRRAKGVGKDGDVEKRCTINSEEWQDGIFRKPSD